jgi:hypothetical protein
MDKGLEVGANTLTARGPSDRATLTITNHPIGGPIFSGPQIQPWYCLPDALDAQCNRPSTFTYHYKSTDPTKSGFQPYDSGNPPSDVASTTTDEGKTVPYVVRMEAGNMNRSQYLIAVLAAPGEKWDRWTGPAAWNHKVYVTHGGGCAGFHTEGAAPPVLNELGLSRGFAVMSAALEDSIQNCNVVVQAESVMMLKEHLIEIYGDIRYLIGTGNSGGSLAQLHMANAYPGLYDGLTVGATFPDNPINDLLDCPALMRYFDNPTKWALGVMWTEASMAAASGKASTSVCRLESAPGGPEGFSHMFEPGAPAWCNMQDHEPERVYHPVTNPGGVRCSIQDYMVGIFGTRPPQRWGPVEQTIQQGFANRPYDNVGVQYGLRALQAGDITPAQFVDLNAKVGAVDIDYGSQPQRVEADPGALSTAYRSGVVNEANNLDLVPIIDVPFPGDVDIHDKYKSWALRARLDAANGHHGNHVIWYGPGAGGWAFNADDGNAFLVMDEWLAAIEGDHRDVPREQKVVENKPAGAVDRCDFPDSGVCTALFGPKGASTRWGAGGGIATDVVKCQLKPLQRSDYFPILFTDAQWAQLRSAFPTGVCDWTRPGVGQQHAVSWQTYQAGPGGQPLGPPPQSQP